MPADAAPTTWTVQQLLAWTTKHFASKNIDQPSVEARTLLAHVLQCTPIDVLTRYGEEPTDPQRKAYRQLIEQRLAGCPVAYLVGTRDFYLLNFDVNSAVLIPRPDTETLVEATLAYLKHKPAAKILDVGTGSGCIAVSIAHQLKQASVTAIDISPDAAEVARKNAKKHGVMDRISILVGDLFAPVAGQTFDAIVSNPPYIPPSEIETLEVGVKDYEPRLALDGGPDGLAFYRRLASEAPTYLVNGGQLLMEIGWTQEPAVRAILQANARWHKIESHKDMGGRWRVVKARLK
jgi:release factor glutamine methyltransferase